MDPVIIKEEEVKTSQLIPETKEKKIEGEGVGKLFGALAKAQMEMEMAKQESKNPFFKSNYADLASVVKASRPYLAKNGLCVIQRVVPNNQGDYLYTVLGHSSGQLIESKMRINPPKHDIQTIGSYITYLRRYSYAAIVGVVAADEDDDGESAMLDARKGKERHAKPIAGISKERLEVLAGALEGHEDILESLLKGFKISKLSELPASKFTICLNRIQEIKRAKEA